MWIKNAAFPPPSWPPYDVTLKIWVDLEAYETKTVSQNITLDMIGEYHVWVEGLTGIFTVGTWPPEPPLKPAELVLSDLSITPETAELWGDIDVWTFKITVNVTNVGEQDGMDKINLRVDGSIVDWRTVKLKAGEQVTITYDVTRGVGSYTVEVDGLTGNFTVKAPPKPAEFEFSNLRIFYPGVIPPEVERDQTVTVTVSIDVTNVGEEMGGYTVKLKVNGTVVDSADIAPFGGGVTATQLFELTRGEGTYQVEVEGLTESFTVASQPKPPFWTSPGFTVGIVIIVATAAIIYLRRRQQVVTDEVKSG